MLEKDELPFGEVPSKEKELSDEKLYGELAVEDKALAVEPNGDDLKTLTDKMQDSQNVSDTQAAQNKLFPEDLGDEITNKLMIGRIAPDAFLPLMNIHTKHIIANSDPTKSINVPNIITGHYILGSVGLDGKGRIDILENSGAGKDKDELDKVSKLFGA